MIKNIVNLQKIFNKYDIVIKENLLSMKSYANKTIKIIKNVIVIKSIYKLEE